MIKNVILKKHIWKGITHNEISFPKRYTLFGADTETVNGDPYTFQVSSDGKQADLVFVNRENVLDKFLEYIEPRLLEGHVNIMYFHNLAFDLPVLLRNFHNLFVTSGKLQLEYKRAKFDCIVKKVYFGRIYFPDKKTLTLVDSYAFFTGTGKRGLSSLAESLNLPFKKQERQKNIGKKKYKRGTAEYKRFVEYAKADAVVEWHLGDWIVNQYKKYNTRVCVSSPQFSMRVFKHYFLDKHDTIKFPPPPCVRGSLLSYHGGKNGFYLDGVTVVKKCYEYDVTSMYPYAMKSMPNFLHGTYVRTRKFEPDYEGVYCITGKINPCRYPVIFSHDFKAVNDRAVKVWITSYELREALKYNEIELENISGWIWLPDEKKIAEENGRNPFAKFVDYFFKLKDTAETKPEKILAKLILNSLYGKMIQTIPEEDTDDKKEGVIDYNFNMNEGNFIEKKGGDIFIASGMFNPFIASLITGFARAYLHRLEHEYEAIHSSTDSIKTLKYVEEIKGLGGIKKECFGECILFRNKLYLHNNRYNPSEIGKFMLKYKNVLENKNSFNHKTALAVMDRLEKGKSAEILEKYALHGFSGTTEQLKQLFETKSYEYKTEHLFKVREAYRQKKTALDMQEVDKKLHGVNFKKVDYL